MGNSQEIHFGKSTNDDEYQTLLSVCAKFNSPEERSLHAQVRAHCLPEWEVASELCDFISLACLRYRRYDVTRAIERMENYFKWRMQTMGSLAEQDTSKDSVIFRIGQLNLIKLLPKLTARGQSIMYLRLCFARPDLFIASEIVQAVHHVILSALRRSEISQVMGIVSLSDLENAGSAQLDKQVPKQMIHMLSKHLPVRLAGVMLCHPNYLVSILVPLAKIFMSSKMASRLKVVNDVAELIEYYGIDVHVLPVQLGGTYVVIDDGNLLDSGTTRVDGDGQETTDTTTTELMNDATQKEFKTF